MDRMNRKDMRLVKSVAIAIAFLAAAGIARPAAQGPVALGAVEKITVHGKSLEGNLDGDTPDRAVFVYLPPSYKTDLTRRFPVAYLLHGYGLQAERWMTFARIETGANQSMTGSGGGVGTGARAREMILVNPDAYTVYDGSMYSSSVTTGDWETFIAEDLVAYIDSHYRTLANRTSRGLAGHSMGGYGTLRLGMKRPDVFSSLYPMSACCMLENGEPNEALAAAEALKTREAVAALRYPNKSTFARAAAWSPNPKNPPFFVDLPVKDGVPQPAIQAKWLANSPLAMIDQYATSLKRHKAIQFDVGLEDGLLGVNQQLDALLTQAGIAHRFETYDGNHNNKVFERIETRVLPFFSTNLEFK
jgi:S-formylglutathione hydrolase FrmB